MRIDVVSIFPSYFDGLTLSLLGKAQSTGILDLQIHDLRDWTTTVTARSTTRPTAAARAWS